MIHTKRRQKGNIVSVLSDAIEWTRNTRRGDKEHFRAVEYSKYHGRVANQDVLEEKETNPAGQGVIPKIQKNPSFFSREKGGRVLIVTAFFSIVSCSRLRRGGCERDQR